jgi:hypothetical protein
VKVRFAAGHAGPQTSEHCGRVEFVVEFEVELDVVEF